MNGNHLKSMLVGGTGVFGALLLFGVPLSSALLYAVLLACPLMMITMGGHGGHGGEHDHSSQGRSSQGRDESTSSTATDADVR
ncbi:DUF2933 domain-containing protein [Nocardioides taihuensis]|uniref:DUF2933 domain-containing protein n=1 Tax=Nocardioides taihuensis TaxID=1835606 RepID=A0ABW0BCV3_9ACTN